MFTHQQPLTQYLPIEKIKLPTIPHVVNAQDLDEDGSLLTQKQTQLLLTAQLPQGYINRSLSNSKYHLVKINSDFYALYKKHKLGEGAFGTVVPIQHLQTHEWFACKIALPHERESISEEYTFLKNLDPLLYS